jgi:hypothetical protein
MSVNRTVLALSALAVLLAGVAIVPAASAQTQDSAIGGCGTIDAPGTYQLTRDVQTTANGSCLVVESGDVTIDGNGYEFRGAGGDSTGILVSSDYEGGTVTLRNIDVVNWGNWGIEQDAGNLVVENASIVGNGGGYTAGGIGSVELADVDVRSNQGTGIDTTTILAMRITGTNVVENGGSGLSMIDGGDVTIDRSQFDGNGGYGMHVGHSMNLTATNAGFDGNEGGGVLIAGSGHGTAVTVAESTISSNGGDGVRGLYQSETNERSRFRQVAIQDNDGKALNLYDEQAGEPRAEILGENVTLGSIDVDFPEQALDLDTEAAEGMDSPALAVGGGDSVEVTARFSVGGSAARLWKETAEGWEQRGEYDPSFEARIGSGRWAVTEVTETDTSTPTGTSTNTTSNDSTSTPMNSTSNTATSTPTNTTSSNTTSTPTNTTSSDTTSTPTNTTSNTPTPDSPTPPGGTPRPESTTAGTSTDVPETTDTSAETEASSGNDGSSRSRSDRSGSGQSGSGQSSSGSGSESSASSPDTDASTSTGTPEPTGTPAPTDASDPTESPAQTANGTAGSSTTDGQAASGDDTSTDAVEVGSGPDRSSLLWLGAASAIVLLLAALTASLVNWEEY